MWVYTIMTQSAVKNHTSANIYPHQFNILGGVIVSLLVHLGIFIHFNSSPEIIRLGESVNSTPVQIRVLPAKEIVTKVESTLPKKALKKAQTKNQTAKPETASTPTQKEVSLAAGEQTVLASYLEQVRLAVEAQKYYPASARRMRQEGVVEATFILNRSGKLTELIAIHGPYEALNQAVEDLLHAKVIFPAMPADLLQEDVRITLPISFELL